MINFAAIAIRLGQKVIEPYPEKHISSVSELYPYSRIKITY
jgi:hypothetical protein